MLKLCKVRFYVLPLVLVVLLPSRPMFCTVLSCDTLKDRIEKQLQARGVQSYRLDIVPVGAEEQGKRVGTCNGGTQKIIYSRHDSEVSHMAPDMPQPSTDELKMNVDWSFRNEGSPCADCNATDRKACCATCAPPGNGPLPRNQIAAQAAVAAKNGGCEGAVALLAQTQCHNPHVLELFANHHREVCELLKQH